jgi:hypothetical protein
VSANPYAETFAAYWDAGWQSHIMPMPHKKKAPPPSGRTGYNAEAYTYPDLQTHADEGRRTNIALHLPDTFIGIDVDDYDNKTGGATLATLEEECGPRPPTFVSTARDGISGIRIYRVPPGTKLVTVLPGVEICQAHHRYAMVAPSWNPKADAEYRWIDEQTGEVLDGVPNVADIPELPAAWLQQLSDTTGTKAAQKAALTDPETVAVATGLPDGEPCEHVKNAAGNAVSGGARHDSYRDAQLAVIGHGRDGCPGGPTVLRRLHEMFAAEMRSTGEDLEAREQDWKRGLQGALRIAATRPQGRECPDVWINQLDGGDRDQVGVPNATPDDTGDELDDRGIPKNLRRINWAEAWANDTDTGHSWVIAPLIPTASATSLYSPAGVGKSLLALEAAAAVATGGTFLGEPVQQLNVAYIDQENSMALIKERLDALGYGPETDLSRLHYFSLGEWAPADTATGGAQLAKTAETLGVELVILDTVSRIVQGEENDAATYQSLYRHTILGLKARGIAVVRLDHSGKDIAKGQRGSSAKADDVDLTYRMTSAGQNRVTLKREKNRLFLDGEDVLILRREGDPLRHQLSVLDTENENKVQAVLDVLETLEVPNDAGRDTCRKALRAQGHKATNSVLSTAIGRRKPVDHGGTPVRHPLHRVPDKRTGAQESAGTGSDRFRTGGGQVPDSSGDSAQDDLSEPKTDRQTAQNGHLEAHIIPSETPCATCLDNLSTDRAAYGKTQCVPCERDQPVRKTI